MSGTPTDSKPARPVIVVAGGGTGGHVFPGLALADALRELAEVEVVFAGTTRGLEARIVPERGYRLRLLDVAPMKGGGPWRAIKGAAVASRATWRAVSLVKELAPRVVVSVGGYAAGPLSLASALSRVPVVLVEPNSVVGLANRLMAPFARRAYVAFEEAAAPFRPGKVLLLGAPLRAGFGPRPYGATDSARLLVLGGSQGAGALNDRMPEATALVARTFPAVEVLHQTGKDRVDAVRAAYAANKVNRATVVPFIDDVAERIAQADLVVGRAGASSVAEIAAVGRASILIPFPHAADDHQARNALGLARVGGAFCLRQEAADAVRIALEVERLLGDPAARTRMADAARAFGKPHAATDIARDILALAGLFSIARTEGQARGDGERGSPPSCSASAGSVALSGGA